MENKINYKPGDLVFVKQQKIPFWPARIESVKNNSYMVFVFGSHKRAEMNENDLFPYSTNLTDVKKKMENFQYALYESINNPNILPKNMDTVNYFNYLEYIEKKDDLRNSTKTSKDENTSRCIERSNSTEIPVIGSMLKNRNCVDDKDYSPIRAPSRLSDQEKRSQQEYISPSDYFYPFSANSSDQSPNAPRIFSENETYSNKLKVSEIGLMEIDRPQLMMDLYNEKVMVKLQKMKIDCQKQLNLIEKPRRGYNYYVDNQLSSLFISINDSIKILLNCSHHSIMNEQKCECFILLLSHLKISYKHWLEFPYIVQTIKMCSTFDGKYRALNASSLALYNRIISEINEFRDLGKRLDGEQISKENFEMDKKKLIEKHRANQHYSESYEIHTSYWRYKFLYNQLKLNGRIDFVLIFKLFQRKRLQEFYEILNKKNLYIKLEVIKKNRKLKSLISDKEIINLQPRETISLDTTKFGGHSLRKRHQCS